MFISEQNQIKILISNNFIRVFLFYCDIFLRKKKKQKKG